MRIVIVEDEIRIREGLRKLVEKISGNYEVVAAADNGKDGYEQICRYMPDVVISDILMPEMSGIEMLEKLKEQDRMPSAILISAYSEFSYAQTAIRLGVREYLTKPVTIDELTGALVRMEEESRKNDMVPEALGSLGNVMFGALNGVLELNDEVKKFLSKRYGIDESTEFAVVTTYLGYYYDESIDVVRNTLKQITSGNGLQNSIIVEMPGDMSLVTVTYNINGMENVENIVQESIRDNSVSLHRACVGLVRAYGIEAVYEKYKLINEYLHWNMVLGDDVLITVPHVTGISAEKSVYPLETEKRMKAAVYAKDKVAALSEVREFGEYYFCGRLFDPKDIKDAYSRFIWVALETGRDIHHDPGLTEMSQNNIAERIDKAKRRGEIKDILGMVFEEVLKDNDVEDRVGLTVKKTIRLIHDFYKDGITLDEIAGRLNITPEYLSAQFQKEVGMNFSTYIRNYRIGKAKQLLVGSNMKVYEVAAEVGYQDSKYFSRVFRQVTGQKPDEYRKIKR